MKTTIVTALFAFLVAGSLIAAETNAPAASEPDDRPDITTRSGVTYQRCKVQRVEPDGISVFHSKGIAKIPFPDLPEEYQKRYEYDPQEASEYSRKMAEARRRAAARRQAQWEKQQDEAELRQAHKELVDLVAKQKMAVAGEVLQVYKGGVLLNGAVTLDERWEPDPTDDVRRMGGPRMRKVTGLKTVTAEYEPIFIVGIGPGLHDGASWAGAVYPAGTYQYTTVMGAPKTVKRCATSPELAVQVELEE